VSQGESAVIGRVLQRRHLFYPHRVAFLLQQGHASDRWRGVGTSPTIPFSSIRPRHRHQQPSTYDQHHLASGKSLVGVTVKWCEGEPGCKGAIRLGQGEGLQRPRCSGGGVGREDGARRGTEWSRPGCHDTGRSGVDTEIFLIMGIFLNVVPFFQKSRCKNRSF